MEKRLPLALFLCFAVLMAWSMWAAPKKRPEPAPAEPGGAAPAGAPLEPATGPSTSSTGEPAQPADRPQQGEVIVDTEERTQELRIGVPGQPGSYLATFSNRGARLMDLRLASFYDVEGLDEAARLDSEHWVQLLRSVPQRDGSSTGSLVWSTSASSAALQHEPLERALWRMQVLGTVENPEGVEFTLAPGTGMRFVKRVRWRPGSYDFQVELKLHNEGAQGGGLPAEFLFTPAGCVPRASDGQFYVGPNAAAAGSKSKGKSKLVQQSRKDRPGNDLSGTLDPPGVHPEFAGDHNKYFAAFMRVDPETDARVLTGANWRRVYDAGWAEENPAGAADAWRFISTDVRLGLSIPEVGESRTWSFQVYLGPKDRRHFQDGFEPHEAVIRKDLVGNCFMTPPGTITIGTSLLSVLRGLFALFGNYGVAIIVMTFGVRLVLFPLNRRSQASMARYQKKMKRVQPRLNEIKEKYAKNPQKLRQEQAKIMQEEGAMPPLGGCLPMFIQIPIFFGLFSALRTSFDLRQAPFFGWITDLSMPDRLLVLNFNTHLPVIGTIEYLNILPPIMVVLWIWQMSFQPPPADEQAARMQKMMKWMPAFMGVFLYNYAAGLSVYMITTSGLGVLEMGWIKKKWPVDDTEKPRKKKSGFMARMAELQAQQKKRLQGQQGSQRKGGGGAAQRKKKKGKR